MRLKLFRNLLVVSLAAAACPLLPAKIAAPYRRAGGQRHPWQTQRRPNVHNKQIAVWRAMASSLFPAL